MSFYFAHHQGINNGGQRKDTAQYLDEVRAI